MAKKVPLDEFESTDEAPKRSRGRKRGSLFLWFGLAALTILIVLLPRVVANRTLLVSVIDRFGGLRPLKVDVSSVEAGWFAPVAIRGLQVIDREGNLFAKVGLIETQKGLWSWLLASNELQTIRLRDIEVDVECFDGTTNIERAIEHLVTGTPSSTPSASTGSKSLPTGSIEVANAQLRIKGRASAEQWLVKIPRLKASLPTASQFFGPIQLEASLAADGAPNATGGTVAAELAQAEFNGAPILGFRAAANSLPLGIWRVLRERLPEVPIRDLAGVVSAQIAGSVLDDQHWSFDIQKLDGEQLRLDAPSLVGTQPAQLQQVSLAARCALTDRRLSLEKVGLNCDIGTVAASGQLPWPVVLPAITQPWLPGATIETNGSLDLAKLVKATQTLIPMRDDAKIVSGSARFRVSQSLDQSQRPVSKIDVELGDLVAVASGKSMKWDKPLKASISAGPQPDGGLRFDSQVQAEFCDLTGSGNAEQGSISGKIDLDRMQQRVAQLVALPIRSMTGSAKVDAAWSQSEKGKVKADGRLATTSVDIAMASGGRLREPAWNGSFTALAAVEGSRVTQIEGGHVELKAERESLQLDLLEPFSLVTSTSKSPTPPLPPAAFKISLRGDVANWQRRASAFQVTIPDTQIGGNLDLAANGRVDLQHAEVSEASWKCEPLTVSMPNMRLAEPRMVGAFTGRVDTADFTKLAIEKLELRATSFSLGAADAAAVEAGGSRTGRAAFLVDLGRLMSSVENTAPAAPAVLPPGANPPSNSILTLSGRVQGEMGWNVNSQSAAFTVRSTGENLEVLNQMVGAGAPGRAERLWLEPTLAAQCSGVWLAADNSVKLDALRLQAPWIDFAGSLRYEASAQQQSIRLNGQCAYEASQVGERFKPWTGNHVQLAGQRTVPVEVNWSSKTGDSKSFLAGLQAATRIGWDQARVVGIEVGKADVPISVTNGKLATAAEIPVSGGTLRWDVEGDLAGEKMMLVQKPMVVLENMVITPEMCESWLKYVAPLLAEVTAVEGRLSLRLREARLDPINPRSQLVDGEVAMHNAEVGPGPLASQVTTIVQQLNAIRKQDLTQAVSTQRPWVKMPEQAINFRMENGQVVHRNLNIRAGDVTISTSGTVDIDGRMELLAEMPIPNDWADKSQWLAGMRGRSLQFPVRGTLGSPQVDTQLLRQFGRESVQQAAQGFLQKELSRGIGKLLGTPPTPQGPTGQ